MNHNLKAIFTNVWLIFKHVSCYIVWGGKMFIKKIDKLRKRSLYYVHFTADLLIYYLELKFTGNLKYSQWLDYNEHFTILVRLEQKKNIAMAQATSKMHGQHKW